MNKINQLVIATTCAFKANNKVSKNNETNSETAKISQDLNSMAVLGKSQINFRGGGFKLDPNDRLFIGAIAATFGLSSAILDKVKNVVADYLKDNNYKSMSDIGGEENIDQQCELTDKINEVIKLDNKDYERLVSKIIDRCDEGDNYFPSDDSNEIDMEELLRSAIKNNVEKGKENDEKFINTLVRVLNLDEEKQIKLRNIINESLEHYNLKSLQNFRDNEDNILAYISEQIETGLNLTENEGTAVTLELINRIYMGSKYEPQATKLDMDLELSSRDSKVYSQVAKNYDIAYEESYQLNRAMKRDAEKRNYKSILELFSTLSNIEEFTETNKILDSIMSQDEKFNFIIDMHCAAANAEHLVSASDEEDDVAYINYSKCSAVVCALDDELNLSGTKMKDLKKYLTTQKFNFEDEKDIFRVAYELTDNELIPSADFDKVVEIIKNVNSFSEEDLIGSNIRYCDKIIQKR